MACAVDEASRAVTFLYTFAKGSSGRSYGVNVAKLANFIKHQARGLQIIAVSLKDQFYTEAEALVGVAKDLSAASSKPFCLDLAKYQQVAA